MNIEVTLAEAKLVTDVIDFWIAGVEESKELTTEDRTIDSAEQLCDLMSGYDDDLQTLTSIRRKLNPPEPELKTPDEKRAFSRAWDERYEEGMRNRHG